MMLHKLITQKNLIGVGLNSGTSADGLDLAAVKISWESNKFQVKFIKGKTVNYPSQIRRALYKFSAGKEMAVDEMIRLDHILGDFYGKQAARFCTALAKSKKNPRFIASHGQTVRHLPGKIVVGKKKQSGTLQLGHPETIAQKTSLVTVADFRQADIAVGGEGAPITAYAMYLLLADKKENRLFVNIGGISNYFLFEKNRPPDKIQAADCGPGNSLIDILSSRLFSKKYDSAGRLAGQGKVSMRLLTLLLADDFLKGKYGPSTGRERFGEELADRILSLSKKLGLPTYDILATTTELTVLSIARKIDPLIKKYKLKKLYLLGGGGKNKYLLRRLRENIDFVDIFSVDSLGYDSDYLEATCYAVLGFNTLKSIASGLPKVTGAKKYSITGRIVQPVQDKQGKVYGEK